MPKNAEKISEVRMRAGVRDGSILGQSLGNTDMLVPVAASTSSVADVEILKSPIRDVDTDYGVKIPVGLNGKD
jgi:hypothetical protein